MAILSDVDIRRELGENILIYPFREGFLKGASYNLSASELAWDLETKENIYNEQEKAIIIPPNSTAVIETNETIWVSQRISGTYHSRVSQVSHGTGHIGTTLDPNYIGPSLIAVHNHSKEPVRIYLATEPFATLKFHYLQTPSSKEKHGNSHARTDILGALGIILTSKERQELDQPYMSDDVALKAKMLECQDYQRIEQERVELIKSQNQEFSKKQQKSWFLNLIIIAAISTVLAIAIGAFLSVNETKIGQNNWYQPAKFTTEKVIELLAIVWVTSLANYVIDKSRK